MLKYVGNSQYEVFLESGEKVLLSCRDITSIINDIKSMQILDTESEIMHDLVK